MGALQKKYTKITKLMPKAPNPEIPVKIADLFGTSLDNPVGRTGEKAIGKSYPLFPQRQYFYFQNLLTNQRPSSMIVTVPIQYVSVAQLDRASDYGSEGRVFESCHSRKKSVYQKIYAFFVGIGKGK